MVSQCIYREAGGQQLAGVSCVFQYLDHRDQSKKALVNKLVKFTH